ncbi:MAG: Hpt domain-containing protein [Paracoccaceae bacterium]|nr:Hpt domain-containing protein [Paracoccaceae bacterium]
MINWTRVSELQAEIGTEDFSEVVTLFLEEADEVTARMRAGIPAADREIALHFLKGSALNLGFIDLAMICQDGEKAAAAGHANLVEMDAVLTAYETAKKYFLAGLKRNSAA